MRTPRCLPMSSVAIPLNASQAQELCDRRTALGVLARSPAQQLSACVGTLPNPPAFAWLRPPETGTLMLRGRVGGDGELFNLGEATLTRCTLRTSDGVIGVGTVLGRDATKAQHVALCDALLQRPESAERVLTQVIQPLAQAEQRQRARHAAQTAASRVDFFTLVRGED